VSDEAGHAWLLINFGDDMSGVAFEAMLRLAALGARVAARLQDAPAPVDVQVLILFEDADGAFELIEVTESKKRWVLTVRVGWQALTAKTDEESDWKVLSYVSGALLTAHAERGLPLGRVAASPVTDGG
jgi:hypothetical protein